MPVRIDLAKPRLTRRCAAMVFGFVAFVAASSCVTGARAGDVNEDEIVRALTPQGQSQPMMHQSSPTSNLRTRGLSAGPSEPDSAAPPAAGMSSDITKLLDDVRGRGARSLSLEERETIAGMIKDKPKVDLEINFDYGSARISSRSMRSVQALGRALTNPALKGSVFVVAGHTDAAGSEEYNQELSERRADSIKRYLVDRFRIAETDLVTVGYGKTKLKDPRRPLASVNRRVQVVNTENKATASNAN